MAMLMPERRVAIIGAGIGGLVAAMQLAAAGCDVVVLEQAATPGGKMREIEIDGRRLDAGPTVLTMRPVFEELFAGAGESLSAWVTLRRAEVLARHAWSASERLDLYSDIDRSAEAIGAFAGAGESRRYRQFCERSRKVYQTLEKSFIRSSRGDFYSMIGSAGLRGLNQLRSIQPFLTLWQAVGHEFHDPRLRQMFARYSTYCGSSPFLAPATLMLIAHVERDGVWLVDGGMHRIAKALAAVATRHGARFRFQSRVVEIIVERGRATAVILASGERIDADAVISNADAAALAGGRFGAPAAAALPAIHRSQRSLSALVWTALAQTEGWPLLRHNVFFSGDYENEFTDIFRRGRIPEAPTVYVCAQDRGDTVDRGNRGAERLLCLVNAPATGDSRTLSSTEIEKCQEQSLSLLRRCGTTVQLRTAQTRLTTPSDFDRLFPATGGALYGTATHGWRASFTRPRARSRIRSLYLAGGSIHPGPGVPMAALSGCFAAKAVMEDLASIRSCPAEAMRGGISMR